jgi:hypothetical protein
MDYYWLITIALLPVYFYLENKYCSKIGREIGREIIKARKER